MDGRSNGNAQGDPHGTLDARGDPMTFSISPPTRIRTWIQPPGVPGDHAAPMIASKVLGSGPVIRGTGTPDDHCQRSGILVTQSGSKIAFCSGNSRPPKIQMKAEFCPRVSDVMALRPNPLNICE